jgi:hypothetical protein
VDGQYGQIFVESVEQHGEVLRWCVVRCWLVLFYSPSSQLELVEHREGKWQHLRLQKQVSDRLVKPGLQREVFGRRVLQCIR